MSRFFKLLALVSLVIAGGAAPAVAATGQPAPDGTTAHSVHITGTMDGHSP